MPAGKPRTDKQRTTRHKIRHPNTKVPKVRMGKNRR